MLVKRAMYAKPHLVTVLKNSILCHALEQGRGCYDVHPAGKLKLFRND